MAKTESKTKSESKMVGTNSVDKGDPSSDVVSDPIRSLRWAVYAILICIAVGWSLGRIGSISTVEMVALQRERMKGIPVEVDKLRVKLEGEQTPVVDADGKPVLAEDGTPKKRPYTPDEIAEKLGRKTTELTHKYEVLTRPFLSGNDRSRWCTARALVEPEMRVEGAPYAIDRVVQQPGWDTIDMVKHDDHLYSSKPPLFPTLLAGAYWCVCKVTGWTLGTHPFAVGRILLVLFNLVPLTFFFVVMAALAERLARSDWARIFMVAAATMGTMLTTFVVVVNNHLPAAVTAAVTLYALVKIWLDDDRRWRWFFLAGLAAALVASFELPGAAMLGGVGLLLLFVSPKKAFLAALPAVMLVAIPYFVTNYVAHDSWRLPYMHRSETDPSDNWYSYSYVRDGRTIRSYWENPQGNDRGEADRAKYAIHCLVGHHGVFSLTPIWALSVLGLAIWLVRGDGRTRLMAAAILALSALILYFYLVNRPEIDRNYGGMTCGLRWVFWLIPFWLVAMLPALDLLDNAKYGEAMCSGGSGGWYRGWIKFGRAVVLTMLVVSIFSVVWPNNPWSDPWLEVFLNAAPTLWGV